MPGAGRPPAASRGGPGGPTAGGTDTVARSRGVVEQLFRHSAGRIVATLARVLGPARLDVAEEAVQEAMLRALQRWPYAGVPDNPAGWLFQVARNTAVDRVRHDEVVRAALPLLVMGEESDEQSGDDELALMFLCCHPGLPLASQVVLTLKTVGGLGVGEIAAALLAKPAAVAQRLVRAKRWLRDNPVLLEVDPSRVDSVLSVLYLLFDAGYDASEGDSAVRAELCGEAIRLCRLLCADQRTGLPRTRALLALMLLQASRLRARTDPAGDILLLSDQDRSRWDQAMIAEGTRVFGQACTGDERSAFHVEAAIALCHAMAPDVEHTDWARVVSLYDDLLTLKPSPVAALNRAIAAAMAGDLDRDELARLEHEPALRDYPLLPAALGALLLRAGEPERAAAHYRAALTKPTSAPTRRFLERQLDQCSSRPGE
jgi:RNA polymerase sigma-70 factor (ECF subfamily)